MLSSEFKIMKAFLLQPSRPLYGREIERLAGTTHERTTVYLDKLAKRRILNKEKRGRQVFYSINKNSIFALKALSFSELERTTEFARKSELSAAIQDMVARTTQECTGFIYFILLFGSAARGHERESSDIDLLFVLLSNGKTGKRIENIAKKQEIIIGRKFSVHTITLPELGKKWDKEPIYRNIWDERIVFFGEENFWRFVFIKGEPHGR